jgi:hypothetical protein
LLVREGKRKNPYTITLLIINLIRGRIGYLLREHRIVENLFLDTDGKIPSHALIGCDSCKNGVSSFEMGCRTSKGIISFTYKHIPKKAVISSRSTCLETVLCSSQWQ